MSKCLCVKASGVYKCPCVKASVCTSVSVKASVCVCKGVCL